MTNQEAIKMMQNASSNIKSLIEQVPVYKGDLSEIREALDMAIAALEKQEPKKPKEDNMHRYCCPSCGNIIAQFDHGHYLDEYFPHCEYCGQAIDWTELLEEKGLIE